MQPAGAARVEFNPRATVRDRRAASCRCAAYAEAGAHARSRGEAGTACGYGLRLLHPAASARCLARRQGTGKPFDRDDGQRVQPRGPAGAARRLNGHQGKAITVGRRRSSSAAFGTRRVAMAPDWNSGTSS